MKLCGAISDIMRNYAIVMRVVVVEWLM